MTERQYMAFYFASLRVTARKLGTSVGFLNMRVHNWMFDVHGPGWPARGVHRGLRAIRAGHGL